MAVTAAADLAAAVARALAIGTARPGIREVEVLAAASRSLLARLDDTSHIPCNGVEEPKSAGSAGLGRWS
jgi:hypothetical protein